jgi:hypothetical protein
VGFQRQPNNQRVAGWSLKRVQQFNPSNTNPVDGGVLEAEWDGGMAGRKDEYVRIASKRCPAPRTDTPSKTARMLGIGMSSHFSSPSFIRKSQTGLLLPWVTQFLEH